MIQRRADGSVDFDQLWDAYKNGFGDLRGRWMMASIFLSQDKRQLNQGRVIPPCWPLEISTCWSTVLG